MNDARTADPSRIFLPGFETRVLEPAWDGILQRPCQLLFPGRAHEGVEQGGLRRILLRVPLDPDTEAVARESDRLDDSVSLACRTLSRRLVNKFYNRPLTFEANCPAW